MAGDWAYDRIFESLVRELVEDRAEGVELASPAARQMSDVKKDETTTGRIIGRQADADRAAFRQMLDDARRRSGERDVEVSYDSADENQDRQADLIARYLVSLGYAEMRTEEQPKGHAIYRVRFQWDRFRRWHEPGD